MKRYILVLAVLLSGITANGQKLQEDEFAKANAYYNDSKYDSALIVYNRITEEGYMSSSLFYNMGNSYFKMRNIPMAIYYYERSLKLDPGNEDAKSNLAITNALITDKIEPLPVFFITKAWRNVSNIFTADEWVVFSIILLALLLISTFIYIIARTKVLKKNMFFTGVILLIFFVLSVIISAQKSKYIKSNDEGIVIRPTITLKSSPSASGVDLFVLHEGTKVEISESESGWNKIRIADGSIGWLPEDALVRF